MITKTIKVVCTTICIAIVTVAYVNLTNALPVAVKIQENVVLKEIKKDLVKLKAPEKKIGELANAVYTSHQSTGFNPKLIVALMYTESKFNKDAIGPPNRTNIRYKGLLQTPTYTSFSNVDTLHGLMILKEKLEITDHDLRKALALYKGGLNPTALGQADVVLALYQNLQHTY